MSRRVRASAPGKVILMGEHAAVYGRPALVAALDLRCGVEAEVAGGSCGDIVLDLPDVGVATRVDRREVEAYSLWVRRRWEAWARGRPDAPFSSVCGGDGAHLAKVALGETALALGGWPPVRAVRVASAIPLAGGFGSSAALAVATVAALLGAAGEEARGERIEEIALEIERRQHGRPSGIDHGTALRGGVVSARQGGNRELSLTRLDPSAEALGAFAVYDTGSAAETTGEVVAAVRARSTGETLDPLLDQLEAATARVVALLTTDPLNRARLVEELRTAERCLEELGVVPPAVQAVVRAVEAAGGAAKISGAGSIAGPGAGALLVVWSGEGPHPRPAELAACAAVPCALGAPGLAVEEVA